MAAIRSFATIVATPPKKCGRNRSSSPAERRPLGGNPRRETFGIELRHLGGEDEIGLFGAQGGDIGLPGARVASEILVRGELGRIDEDRDHGPAGLAAGEPEERNMAVMQGAHRGYEGDAALARSKARNRGSQRLHRTNDPQPAGHACLQALGSERARDPSKRPAVRPTER